MRTVSLLSRPAPAPINIKPKRRKKAVVHRGEEDGRSVVATPVRQADGCCAVYDGVIVPRLLRLAAPPNIAKYQEGKLRPWNDLEVGESFFVAGVVRMTCPTVDGKTWVTRFMFLNNVPGMMAWRVS